MEKTWTTERRGSAMIIALFLVLIVTLAAITFPTVSFLNYRVVMNNEAWESARYAAEAGIEYGVYLIQNQVVLSITDVTDEAQWPDLGAAPGHQPYPVFSFGYVVLLEINLVTIDSENYYEITSTGSSKGTTQTVKVRVSDGGRVVVWGMI